MYVCIVYRIVRNTSVYSVVKLPSFSLLQQVVRAETTANALKSRFHTCFNRNKYRSLLFVTVVGLLLGRCVRYMRCFEVYAPLFPRILFPLLTVSFRLHPLCVDD